jgi:hypothetical protein
MMETRETPQSEIDVLVAAMLATDSSHSLRRARRELEAHPRDEAVQGLIRGMRHASHQKAFDRAAKLLAEYGGDEAAEALAREARTQRQYPRLAVRALALCDHPRVVPELLDILEFSTRIKQRRAAAFALARLRAPLAVEPLCKASTMGRKWIGQEAVEALHVMGRPDQIARLVLGEETYAAADRVRVLHAMACAGLCEGFWRRQLFDVNRFLHRESQDARSPVRDQAVAAAEFLTMQSTLLRGLEESRSDTLLRAASGGSESSPDSLLRASELAPGEGRGSRGPSALVAALWSFILGLVGRR